MTTVILKKPQNNKMPRVIVLFLLMLGAFLILGAQLLPQANLAADEILFDQQAQSQSQTSRQMSVPVTSALEQPQSQPHLQEVQNHQPQSLKASKVRFVFCIGLEGTGHHLMRKILKSSPSLRHLNKLDLMKRFKNLQNAIFSSSGLFHLHCGKKVGNKGPYKGADVQGSHDYVVDMLKTFAEAVGPNEPVTISLNAFGSHFQMASYPQDKDACRDLKYPNLDLLYSACEDAGVDCGHVYLYRDPYAVIKSTTTNRHFNDNRLKAMHLYNSMLNVILGQLTRHADKTMGCFGLLEQNVSKEEVWDPIRHIFGWQDKAKYEAWIEKIYKKPHALSDEKKLEIIPDNYKVYMKSLQHAHQAAIGLCRQQFAANYHVPSDDEEAAEMAAADAAPIEPSQETSVVIDSDGDADQEQPDNVPDTDSSVASTIAATDETITTATT